MSDAAAREVVQDHLDAVSTAVWRRDFAAATARFAYPFVQVTPVRRQSFENAAEMAENLRRFRDALATMGATAYHRVCDGARARDGAAGRIEGSHVTYVLMGGSYLIDPYRCASTLVRAGDAWLCDGIDATDAASAMRHNLFWKKPDRDAAAEARP